MSSPTYALFAQAIIERKQIVCRYGGYRRELYRTTVQGETPA